MITIDIRNSKPEEDVEIITNFGKRVFHKPELHLAMDKENDTEKNSLHFAELRITSKNIEEILQEQNV